LILYYDLHIHSALSPCAEDEMTPNNIVNMAVLKGLDVIAVTDHNSAFNLPAVSKAAGRTDLLLLPGMEITTQEEAHLLAYFYTVEEAVRFGEEIYDSLPGIKNRADLFGNQQIMDEKDEVIGSPEKLLIQATPFSVERICGMVRQKRGYIMPAHVNKASNSLIENLGFIPKELDFSAVEVFKPAPLNGVDENQYRFLYSSDAHMLGNIAERENSLEVREKTVKEIYYTIFGYYA